MKLYLLLTKPGIIFGNAVTMASAFALASGGAINWSLFLFTLVGLGAVIASACVFNHYIDRASDAKMDRTKNRPLVTGMISNTSALMFGLLLALFGFTLLALKTNSYGVGAAAVGFVVYVGLYSVCKHHTVYGTLIGSVAGAMPPIVGYCVVKGRVDLGAGILFAILVLWQMPHFYAIAFYRAKEYASASIPVLPITGGQFRAKVHMACYIVAFIGTSALLTVTGYTGWVYLFVALVGGAIWLAYSFMGFQSRDDKQWGYRMFVVSLAVVMTLCITMALDVTA